jgi:hypothetical protein
MALNIVATTMACLLSYQVLVRYTFVGVLLNGQRQPKPVKTGVSAAADPK